MSDTARHVTVEGRVQGVFFRASTRDRARAAGVSGWVRNRPDGSVEAWLEGPEEAVDEVLAWIRAGGPSGAQIDTVEVQERPPTRPAGFAITG